METLDLGIDVQEIQRVLAANTSRFQELGLDVNELASVLVDPNANTDVVVRKFLLALQRQPEQYFDSALKNLEQVNPQGHSALIKSLSVPSAVLELQGYETWLRTLGPHTFFAPFALFHHEMWQWYWPLAQSQKRGQDVNLEDLTYFAPWGRGLGKSSNAEWLAIGEGCLIGRGFVLYVCSGADQAEAHVESIRERLETEPAIPKLYPGMRKPGGKGGFVGEHKQYGWRQDYLMTANGWAVRPVGLDKAIRGWKRGDTRVTLIIFDDVDDDDDSPDVVSKKLRRIARKILPMGTARTKVVWAQNPVHSNSCLNQMLTRQNNILAVRRGDRVVKSFVELETDFRQTPQGPRYIITHAVGSWPGIDLKEAQSFLDRSDLPAFLAEYQHDFSGEMEERVLPEYDDRILRLHVIRWSQFIERYRVDRIPIEWPCDLGLDIGYSGGHKSVWSFITKVPLGYWLASSIFRYRGRTFTGISIDDQSIAVRLDMWEGEKIERQFRSHEKLGEAIVLNSKHGWGFRPCDSDKNAGWAQWRHYLRPDRTQPHPFHPDTKDPQTGLWHLGRVAWFDIVDDDQFQSPRDDKGLKFHRDSAYLQRMRKIKETESGLTVEQPMKKDDDPNDSTRMLLTTASFGPSEKPLTVEQKIQQSIPQGSHLEEIAARTDLDSTQKQLTQDFIKFSTQRLVDAAKPPEVDHFGQALPRNWRARA